MTVQDVGQTESQLAELNDLKPLLKHVKKPKVPRVGCVEMTNWMMVLQVTPPVRILLLVSLHRQFFVLLQLFV